MAARTSLIGIQETDNSGALGYFYVGTQAVSAFKRLRDELGSNKAAKEEMRRIFELGLDLLEDTVRILDKDKEWT